MPDLIAQGPASGQRWRREIPSPTSHRELIIGRRDADWNVPWDALISRRHIRILARSDDRMEVTRIRDARNPVFHDGRQRDRFTLVPGEHFVIGHTTFTLVNRPGASDSPGGGDVTEHAYDSRALQRQSFRDVKSRIGILSRLPDLITGSTTDEELLVRVVSVLLQSTPSASAVAIVSVGDSQLAVAADDEKSADPQADGLRVLHYDTRVGAIAGPPVSARLVRSAVASRESRLHLWTGGRKDDSAAFTASEDVDWAFCVPLRSEACAGWALYVTGQLGGDPGDLTRSLQAAPDDLGDDVKFAELVGTMLANLRQSLRLERRQTAMRRFFAPVVMEALAKRDVGEVLAPRESELSVLFCDLRGFSRQSEESSDRLLELLGRVSDALGVMTRHILASGGVIGDFHGDAAMGFWGWPLEQDDRHRRAAEAALRIWQDYAGGLHQTGFRCGIGLASGPAVAGRIGTTDQVKVTAFGPVVNLASRLEGISKVFGAEIVLDEITMQQLRRDTSSPFRLRRLADVRPAGLAEPVRISQLLGRSDDEGHEAAGPSTDASGQLNDEQIGQYEEALDHFNAGDWDQAYQKLHALPAWDRPKDVLIGTILRHNRTPPADWQGVIDLRK